MSAPVKVFVPCDAAALSVGADEIAHAIAAATRPLKDKVQLVRNGSRGLLWLEPMVEVQTPAGRVAYGPVRLSDVPGLMAADFLNGGEHPLRLGLTEELPWMKQQQRLCFARCGLTDPRCLEDYLAHQGFAGLRRALQQTPESIVEAINDSGLRGRGGAAFPAGIKWNTVQQASAAQKYIVCNADEGDSGTFSDRMLMEGDPYLLIEGMIIAGLACGASRGLIYLRSEYPHARRTLEYALATARDRGYLGDSVCESGVVFDIELRIGGGAYICGEETSLLESLEGRRGEVRFKPPLPALEGLFGKPTLIHNVITLASVPIILDKGAAFYRDFGMGRSRGSLPIQLAGNIRHGGLIELAFGMSLRELLYDFGGGSLSGRPIRAVQIGGPLGAYLPESQFDIRLDYEAFAAAGAMLGHGGIVVFDDTVDMAAQARYAMEFCSIESCGKCTPCRIGSTRGVEVIDRLVAGKADEAQAAQTVLLRDLCQTMKDGSLCAMGGLTPYPVLSALDYFPEDFGVQARPVGAGATS
tara:strand:- start:13358 stop:14938 length:1581 start_codon:yes stop_codon:yes gene_type:complete